MHTSRWNIHMPRTTNTSRVSVTLLVMLLVACGRAEGMTPEQVHEQYIAALRANDRQQALALTVDRGDLDALQAASVDQQLQRMQTEVAGTTGAFPTGALSRVEILPLVAEGQGMVGWSRWIYPRRTICHQAVLQQTPQGWRVTAWYDSTSCGS